MFTRVKVRGQHLELALLSSYRVGPRPISGHPDWRQVSLPNELSCQLLINISYRTEINLDIVVKKLKSFES